MSTCINSKQRKEKRNRNFCPTTIREILGKFTEEILFLVVNLESRVLLSHTLTREYSYTHTFCLSLPLSCFYPRDPKSYLPPTGPSSRSDDSLTNPDLRLGTSLDRRTSPNVGYVGLERSRPPSTLEVSVTQVFRQRERP